MLACRSCDDDRCELGRSALQDNVDEKSAAERQLISGFRLWAVADVSRCDGVWTTEWKLKERESPGRRRRDGPFNAGGGVLRGDGCASECAARAIADRAEDGCVDCL